MHARPSTVLLLATALAPVACGMFFEPKPDVETLQHYAEHGLAFDYPGNWKLEAEVDSSDGLQAVTITVESSGSGLAMIQQFTPAVGLDPDELLGILTVEMRKGVGEELGGMLDYTQGGNTKTTRALLGADRAARKAKFEVALLGQKVPHSFELITADLDDRSVAVFLQAPDEDLATVTPAFDVIVKSLAAK